MTEVAINEGALMAGGGKYPWLNRKATGLYWSVRVNRNYRALAKR